MYDESEDAPDPDSLVGKGRYATLTWRETEDWYLESQARWGRQCQAELDRREAAREADMGVMEREINVWFRERSKKAHPDAGGSHEEMIDLQRKREFFLEMLAVYTRYREGEL